MYMICIFTMNELLLLPKSSTKKWFGPEYEKAYKTWIDTDSEDAFNYLYPALNVLAETAIKSCKNASGLLRLPPDELRHNIISDSLRRLKLYDPTKCSMSSYILLTFKWYIGSKAARNCTGNRDITKEVSLEEFNSKYGDNEDYTVADQDTYIKWCNSKNRHCMSDDKEFIVELSKWWLDRKEQLPLHAFTTSKIMSIVEWCNDIISNGKMLDISASADKRHIVDLLSMRTVFNLSEPNLKFFVKINRQLYTEYYNTGKLPKKINFQQVRKELNLKNELKK